MNDIILVPDPQPFAVPANYGLPGAKGDPGANVMAIGLFTAASGLSIPLGTDVVRTSGYSTKGVGVADYVNDPAVDSAYVTAHPNSSFMSANARGFRYIQHGDVFLEQFGGGVAAADNASAFAVASSPTLFPNGSVVQLNPGTYQFSVLTVPNWVTIRGVGMFSGVGIMITGNGGGAPAVGSNGGIQLFGTGSRIEDVEIQYNNPALQCLMNCSGGGALRFKNLCMLPASSLTAAQVIAIGLWLNTINDCHWEACTIESFKQDVLAAGECNTCRFPRCVFGPHKKDYANGVFNDRNPMVEIAGTAQAFSIEQATFEQGPNMVKIGETFGTVNIVDNYMSDGIAATGYWLPNTAYAQGNLVYPSASITGSITTGTNALTVSASTNLYVGQKITVIGAGTSGANLSTYITAINGTAVTTHDNAGTTVTNAGVYYGNYSGHGYLCSVAGTSGSSAPTFPTTAAATVVDGGATWVEYGPCACVDASNGDVNNIRGNLISAEIVGVYATRANGFGEINVEGNHFLGNDHNGWISNVAQLNWRANYMDTYHNLGLFLQVTSTQCRVDIRGNRAVSSTNGADIVIGSISTNGLGGSHQGSTVLTGIGTNARLLTNDYNPLGAAPSSGVFSVPGAMLSSGPTAGIGYAAGAGGTITQVTSKATAVTLAKVCGQITMNGASLAASTSVSFTFNNSALSATDRLDIDIVSGAADPTAYNIKATGTSAGSRTITIRNITVGALAEALVLGFNVIKRTIN